MLLLVKIEGHIDVNIDTTMIIHLSVHSTWADFCINTNKSKAPLQTLGIISFDFLLLIDVETQNFISITVYYIILLWCPTHRPCSLDSTDGLSGSYRSIGGQSVHFPSPWTHMSGRTCWNIHLNNCQYYTKPISGGSRDPGTWARNPSTLYNS